MEENKEIYKLYRQHEFRVAEWSNEIVLGSLNALITDGYLLPGCHVLFYNFENNVYRSSYIEMESTALSDIEKRDITLSMLRLMHTTTTDTLIAAKLVTEGTVERDGSDNRMNFLMITIETPLNGKKHIWTYHKTSYVQHNGSTLLKIDEDIKYDEVASRSSDIELLEEFAHLLRPNWSISGTHYN